MTRKRRAASALVLTAMLATAACAPVVIGGPPMPLPPGLQETAQLGAIYMSSDWLQSEDDFADTLTDEVREELSRCMHGTAPVDVRIHIEDLTRASRLGVLLNGDGMHTLSGLVEFVDPRTRTVLGRIPVSVATSAQGRVGGLVGDRQMMVSEEFGRALCEQAFSRNPRPGGLRDATR